MVSLANYIFQIFIMLGKRLKGAFTKTTWTEHQEADHFKIGFNGNRKIVFVENVVYVLLFVLSVSCAGVRDDQSNIPNPFSGGH